MEYREHSDVNTKSTYHDLTKYFALRRGIVNKVMIVAIKLQTVLSTLYQSCIYLPSV